MANGAALAKSGKNQGRRARSPKLRMPAVVAAAPVKTGRLALSKGAHEILARMKADEDFYPDVDETLAILGYRD